MSKSSTVNQIIDRLSDIDTGIHAIQAEISRLTIELSRQIANGIRDEPGPAHYQDRPQVSRALRTSDMLPPDVDLTDEVWLDTVEETAKRP